MKDASFRVVSDYFYKPESFSTLIDADLESFTKYSDKGLYIAGNSSIDNNSPMPDTVTNELIYDNWAEIFKADKTAKENCDIWMKYQGKTSSSNVIDVQQVRWARDKTLGGKPCDIANMYELMVIWACGDKLDELDITAGIYPKLKLGYTSEAFHGGRTYQSSSRKTTFYIASSTNAGKASLRSIDLGGMCKYISCSYESLILPVLEI